MHCILFTDFNVFVVFVSIFEPNSSLIGQSSLQAYRLSRPHFSTTTSCPKPAH